MTCAIRSVVAVTVASSASAGRMSKISYFRIPPPLVVNGPRRSRSGDRSSMLPADRARPLAVDIVARGCDIASSAGTGTLVATRRALSSKEARAMPITVPELRAFKERSERFVMLTAYDYPTARILDEAGIPVLLVGDSVGNNALGYDTTIPVTMEEMLHHTRAVVRGATDALVVGDMPFMSFHTTIEHAVGN